ncbi:MAG: SDR family oxidoreductase [Chloroflexi bacterium]|nr:SDR family oxidoreductase [Chloroflexota bacterium]
MNELTGQVAIITGATQGVGRAVALAVAEAGAHVSLIARRQAELDEVASVARRSGVEAMAQPGDVRAPAAVDAFVKATLERFGRIDVLVNNAGGSFHTPRLRDVAVDDWTATLDLNLVAPFLLVRAVLPTMRAQRRGTIVNIGSRTGLRPTAAGAGSAYAAAKAGLIMFTTFINFEEQQHGIRATVLPIGTTDTPAHLKDDRDDYQEARRHWLRPSDVADAVVFVASRPDNVTIEEMIIRPTNPRYETPRERFLLDS